MTSRYTRLSILALAALTLTLATGLAGLVGCTLDRSKGDTSTQLPTGPNPPAFAVLLVDRDGALPDICEEQLWPRVVSVHAYNAVAAGTIITIELGDGESYVGEGLDASTRHVYHGPGPYTARATVTLSDGTQLAASRSFDPAAACLP